MRKGVPYSLQSTRDTFFPYILEKAQKHSPSSARAHSHPDGHLSSVLPRAGISSDHRPPLLYLWHLRAAGALPRIPHHHYRMGGQPPCLLFGPAKPARRAAPISLSPSGLSSGDSLLCVQIGLVMLSTKLEGSPDSQLEEELPTTYNTSV